MKFSLLVPTRDRHNKLRTFMDSVYKTTTHKKNLEVLFVCDDDDRASHTLVTELIGQYGRSIEMKLLKRPRTEMLNEDYYNWSARQSTGDMIWVLADDLILMAYGWDDIIVAGVEKFAEKYPDKIFCCSIMDNTPPPSHKIPKFPCFPMFTREAMVAQGDWILHPKVPTWGADYITYCIFKPIHRLLEFKDRNYLNHVSWHNKQEEPDEINKRIGSIFNKLKGVPQYSTDRILEQEVPAIRNEVKQKILDFSSCSQEESK